MKANHLIILSIFLTGMLAFSTVEAQEKTASEIAAKAPVVEVPRGKDGKRLFAAMDLMRVNSVGSPRLSPDGTKVAYTVSTIKTEKDKEWKTLTQIWVVPVEGGSPRQFTRSEKSANAPEWSPDGNLLAFLTDREKDGERQVWMMMADGGEAWAVTSHKGGVSSFGFSPDGRQLILLATDQPGKDEEDRRKVKDDVIEIDRNLKMAHLWLWNIEKKDEKRLTEGEFTVSDPQWSPDGNRVSYTTRPTRGADDGSAGDIWVLTIVAGTKRKLTENEGPDANARWSNDGKWIAFTGGPEPGGGVFSTRLYIVAAEGGVPKQISEKFDLNVGTPVWSGDGKMLYFSSNLRQANEIFACDPATGGVTQITRLGGSTGIAAVSNNGKTIIGTSTTAKRPAEIFRSNVDGTGFSLITDHNSWLNEYTLADTETTKWKSKDGRDIEGVLTKPVGFQAGTSVPLLLNPHGGPTGASTNGFNGMLQVLAANGFAVLQPNFRGSTGRGLAFAQANKNTWGKGDYDDCMTGVDALVASGLADPDRLGALGWSYGGYMTFWILTQTDRFKAVSPGAGLSNIYSMYSQNDIQGYLRWFYSDKAPWDATDLYWDRSPMKYINNVKTPTMIMHGQVDTRVPIAQSKEFYQALKERKVPVEFIVYPRENHGFTEPLHQMDRVQRYVRFFAKYLSTTVVTEPAEK